MKHVLFIGWYPNSIDKYRNVFFQNLIYEMARQGVDCTVISPVSIMKYRENIWKIPYHIEEDIGEGVFVHTYYPKTFSASSKAIGKFNTEVISEYFFEKAALNTAKKMNQTFDCVYGHFILYGGLAAIQIGNYFNIPSFFAYGECSFDTEIGNTYGIPKAEKIKGLTGIISVSTKNTNELTALGFVDRIPIITVPNATDLSLFFKRDRNVCRKKLGMPEDKFIVGFVGGFIERKGDKRLLEAVNRLDDTFVAFAGRGEDKPSGDRVVFCQAMEHNDIPVFLNAVDVFVLPTLAEGSCNAIIEAMACGLPIISSDLPFNDDVLNNENSIRIDPMSIDDIREAISTLRDENAREMMGKKALLTAQNLSIARRATRILDFIERCSEKHDTK
ncbi:MAG: glycosyltransferase [Oscillospiraceae bacterium]|nr:glycosyltransferase [Oscillospiraceae bacterium]